MDQQAARRADEAPGSTLAPGSFKSSPGVTTFLKVTARSSHCIREEKITQRLSESNVPPKGTWNSSIESCPLWSIGTSAAFSSCSNRQLPCSSPFIGSRSLKQVEPQAICLFQEYLFTFGKLANQVGKSPESIGVGFYHHPALIHAPSKPSTASPVPPLPR